MPNNTVLVALLHEKRDFAILESENWYRIPVEKTPRGWPPNYLTFYQPRAFGQDAFRIRYFGKIARIDQVKRRELFPNELQSSNSEKLYHRLMLERLEKLPRPIPTRLPRKIVFIPTTWQKFIHTEELNDLYNESELEDLLWNELKHRSIQAERQWPVEMGKFEYRLDFAFFCKQGKLDVETDGDLWHSQPERIARDNRRNNDVTAQGWHVLRFNNYQIQEQCAEYCLPRIQETINTLGGLNTDGMVPRIFGKNGDSSQQLSLFEEQASYEVTTQDSEMDEW